MTESQTVYAYVDLAEPSGSRGVMMVPFSHGESRPITSDLVHRVIVSGDDSHEPRWEGVTLVAGAKALEVAEQEVVRLASEDLGIRPEHGRTFRAWIDYTNGDHTLAVSTCGPDEIVPKTVWRRTCNFPPLARAVDLRDRLRAKAKVRIPLTEEIDADRIVDANGGGVVRCDECGHALASHSQNVCGVACNVTGCKCLDFRRIGVDYANGPERQVVFQVKSLPVKGTPEFYEVLGIIKEPPMPTTKPAPDPHEVNVYVENDPRRAVRRVYVTRRFGGVKRALVLSGVHRAGETMIPSTSWVEIPGDTPFLFEAAEEYVGPMIKAIRDAFGCSDPLVIDIGNVSPADGQRIARELSEKCGRPIVALPRRVHMTEVPVSETIETLVRQYSPTLVSDIDHRADIGDAYRRGKRVGLVFGGLALALFVGLSVTVASVRPAWAIKAVAWVAGQGR